MTVDTVAVNNWTNLDRPYSSLRHQSQKHLGTHSVNQGVHSVYESLVEQFHYLIGVLEEAGSNYVIPLDKVSELYSQFLSSVYSLLSSWERNIGPWPNQAATGDVGHIESLRETQLRRAWQQQRNLSSTGETRLTIKVPIHGDTQFELISKSHIPDIGSGDLSAIAETFDLRTPSAVDEFLLEHPQVKQLLHNVPRQVKYYFGDSRMVLDVRADPDSSSPPELFVYVVTCLSPDEAWNRMKEFEEQWWSESAQDYPVHLHVEFA